MEGDEKCLAFSIRDRLPHARKFLTMQRLRNIFSSARFEIISVPWLKRLAAALARTVMGHSNVRRCLDAESDASKNPTFTMSPDDRPDLQAGLKSCRNYHHLCLASIAGLGAAAVALIAACASTGGKQNALVPPINWSLALRRVPGNRVGGTPGAAFGPFQPLAFDAGPVRAVTANPQTVRSACPRARK